MQTTLSSIPSVDVLLSTPEARVLRETFGHAAVTATLRDVQADLRAQLRSNPGHVWDRQAMLAACALRLQQTHAPTLKPVFNLTGTVLHTNLGRALLSRSAAQAVQAVMESASNLEYDLDSAARGDRDEHIEALICELTGAEAATVVNNNAAAVFLLLNTLAMRKQVIVSRGELIEIGGAFRIPDIMARAGARLVEVGTTNRTHLRDYAEAVTPRTALLMKVHPSNYAIQGFTSAVPEAQVAGLAKQQGIPFVIDLGSGTLTDFSSLGLPKEPTVQEAIAAGADLVTFSGDKLLGGPQAGIVAGRRDLVARLKKNPLKRALRVDKMTMAALAATLQHYRSPEFLTRDVPTLRLLTRSADEIRSLAERLLPPLRQALAGRGQVSLQPCFSQIGSGSLPLDVLPSHCLAIRPDLKGRGAGTALKTIADALRGLPRPVIGRIEDGALLLDLRCLEDEAGFVAQLERLAA